MSGENCWNCDHCRPRPTCLALTLDEGVDEPIIFWCEREGVNDSDDGMPPEMETRLPCPGFKKRPDRLWVHVCQMPDWA